MDSQQHAYCRRYGRNVYAQQCGHFYRFAFFAVVVIVGIIIFGSIRIVAIIFSIIVAFVFFRVVVALIVFGIIFALVFFRATGFRFFGFFIFFLEADAPSPMR
jgi:hypothetical protein